MDRFRQDTEEIVRTMSHMSVHRKFQNCLPALNTEMIDIPYPVKKGTLIYAELYTNINFWGRKMEIAKENSTSYDLNPTEAYITFLKYMHELTVDLL